METNTFSFDLPEELIAQHPADRREHARLMRVDRATGRISHHLVSDLPDLIPPETVMVLNDTRVRKARLQAALHPGGGRCEVLLLRALEGSQWEAMVSRAQKMRPGRELRLPGDRTARVMEGSGGTRVLEVKPPIDEGYLERHGSVPLPPYIRRAAEPEDEERYQTVYARHAGSAAAPTAGLHLTPELLDTLRGHGVRTVFLTLRVGLGTFAPIRSQRIEDHSMHTEEYEIPPETAEATNRAAARGKVLAVGTTVVRALEAAAQDGALRPGPGSTDLYIKPGDPFRIVGSLMTNFHTPRSTLLVLVSAFAGTELIREAYQEAVRQRYRFFSYGDAMLIQ